MLKIIIMVPVEYLSALFTELGTSVKSSGGKISGGECKVVIEPRDQKEEEVVRILKKYSDVKNNSENSSTQIPSE